MTSTALESLPTVDRLTERMCQVVSRRGIAPRRIVLAATATSLLLVGLAETCPEGARLQRQVMRRLTDPDVNVIGVCRAMWSAQVRAFPYLAGHVDALTNELVERENVATACREVFTVLADVDLPGLLNSPAVGGDLLGPVYMQALGRDRPRGEFYTPAPVCQLIATLQQVGSGASVYDPACGSAGMAVALIREMRARGQHPELARWSMNDSDPVAVALAGINLAIHGMPWVTLTCEDALLPDSARPSPSI